MHEWETFQGVSTSGERWLSKACCSIKEELGRVATTCVRPIDVSRMIRGFRVYQRRNTRENGRRDRATPRFP